jgi:hypothetical protein
MALRVCDGCGDVDELPRHLVVYPVGGAPAVDQDVLAKVLDMNLDSEVKASVVADLIDTTQMLYHFDCDPTGVVHQEG